MNILITIIVGGVIGTGVGYLIGYQQRHIKELLDTKPAPPEVGATPASYGRINEYNVNQKGETGLVMPKTPQQLEWEEGERLREAQLSVEVKR